KTYPIKTFPTSDEFSSTALGMQWAWNHNPDTTKWWLTQRPGYLRLATSGIASNFMEARNTLTQRPFAKYDPATPTRAVTKIDVAHLQDGDIAGLAIFQDPYAYIAVKQQAGKRFIIMVNNGKVVDSTQ